MDSGIGYRFHPSDFELVDHYLKHKMLGNDNEVWQIPEIDVLNFEPWDLPQHAITFNNSNDQVWYFFWTPNYKYSNSKRVERTTNDGYWKVTGKDRKIEDIGIKKTLVYHQGRPKGVRTNWIMHQYVPTFNFRTKKDFVICKIMKKLDEEEEEDDTNFEKGASSSTIVANYTENQNWNNNDNSNFHFQQGYAPTMGSASGNYATEEENQVQTYMQSFQGYDEQDYNLNSAIHWPNNYRY